MTLNNAKKIIIITEKFIQNGVCDIIEENGATGYTVTRAGGKGSRNKRSTADRASVVEGFANVKIEVIVNDHAMGEKIMNAVSDAYFDHYSGITYLQDVQILRPEKF